MKTTITLPVPMLSALVVYADRSEETPCFAAYLEFKGRTYEISNEGRGGCNRYTPLLADNIMAELNAWAAATLPPIELVGGRTLAPDFETWTFGEAFAKIGR